MGRVVGGVAARLLSGLRPSLRLRWPATPLEYRCQGDISISVTVYSPATNIACSQPNCEPLLNRKRRKERKDNGLLLVGLCLLIFEIYSLLIACSSLQSPSVDIR